MEVKPPKKKTRHGRGKSDPVDAFAAARSVLGKRQSCCFNPRCDGERAAISMLLAARRRSDHQHTAYRNALVRLIDLGFDARHASTEAQLKEISEWRTREHDNIDQRVARAEAIDLAKSNKASKARLKVIEAELVDLDEKMAPGL
ncbi:hypothetical protein ABIB48_001743 [Arthrobacter sp. UYCu511]|uniref:hypothetical protein n=1 Tax=Arthrobacter sp. UYCu511 TaxID=3156337 RepID=UPI0033943271